MKKMMTKIGAGVLAMTFACSMASCAPAGDTDYGYMTVDINPSIEFIIEDGIVVDVAANNTDGEVLLAGELLEGKTVKEATEIVVGLADSMGYLTAQNNRVKIVVLAESDKVKAEIETAATQGATEGAGAFIEINHEPRAKDKRKAADFVGSNLSAAKVRLIEELMEYDDSITYDEAAAKTVEQLVKQLKTLRTKYEGIDGEELKAQFKQAIEAQKAQLQTQWNNMMGEAYSQMQAAYQSLEDAFEIIEEKVANITIEEADVASLLDLLGLTQEDLSLITTEAGVVTVESIDDYMDKFYEAVGDQAEVVETQIEGILDKYEDLKDTYQLTQAEYDALVEAWGDRQPALPAFEDLTIDVMDNFVDTIEEQVEALETSVKSQLGVVQKQLMATLEAAFDKIEETVHQQMTAIIQQFKNKYQADKNDRLPNQI